MKLQEIREKHGDLFIKVIFDEVKKLAEENPDFAYSSGAHNKKCFYNKGQSGGPVCSGCIIGQALQRLGWSNDTEMGSLAPVDMLISVYTDYELTGQDFGLSVIQNQQDKGYPWGKCV